MTSELVIATPSVDTRRGGVERFSHTLAHVLGARWNVHMVALESGPPTWMRRMALDYLWLSRSAGSRIRSSTCELAITNGLLGWGASAPRRIHVFHGTMPYAMLHATGVARRARMRWAVGGGIAEFLASRGTTAVAVSETAAQEAKHLYGVECTVIENGVDTDVFQPMDQAEARARFDLPTRGRPIALFVGRGGAGKGADLAAAAAEESGYSLAFAGSGTVAGAIPLGSLSPAELSWAYCASDCVILPTTYEACSYVVLEALACGVPVITTRVGWTRKLEQRVPSYSALIANRTVNDFAKALRSVVAGCAEAPVAEARALVREENSLRRFAIDWMELCASELSRAC